MARPACVVVPAPSSSATARVEGESLAAAMAAAVGEAGLEPSLVDRRGGVLPVRALERLFLAEHAIVDLTAAEPSLLYVVGARDALRRSTVAIWRGDGAPPIHSPSLLLHSEGESLDRLRNAVVARLRGGALASPDGFDPGNPVYALLGEWKPSPLSRTKTDVLRAREPGGGARRRIADALAARGADVATVAEVEAGLGPLEDQEAETVVDLLLAYRAVSAWDRMVALYERMPRVLRRQVLVREQAAFALNRRAGADPAHPDRARAAALLAELEASQGPSPETCALLGRIHKDLWKRLGKARPDDARRHLRLAIDAYRRGWDADPRDAYPGINLLTLLDADGAADALREERSLLPVVRHFVERRVRAGAPDYWDLATLLELAVLEGSEAESRACLAAALSRVRETWEPRTTADNLATIAESRRARGEDTGWLDDVVARLREASS
jgi:hypothetical protein